MEVDHDSRGEFNQRSFEIQIDEGKDGHVTAIANSPHKEGGMLSNLTQIQQHTRHPKLKVSTKQCRITQTVT